MSILDTLFGEKCKRCKENRIGSNKDFCDACKIKIKAGQEEIRQCMKCHIDMRKIIWEEIITDKCPKCKAVWLDGGEMSKIKDLMEDAHSSGSSSGFGSGFVVGSILN